MSWGALTSFRAETGEQAQNVPGVFLKEVTADGEAADRKDIPTGWQIVSVGDVAVNDTFTMSSLKKLMDGKAVKSDSKDSLTVTMVPNLKLCVAYDHDKIAVRKNRNLSLGRIVKLTKQARGFGLKFGG